MNAPSKAVVPPLPPGWARAYDLPEPAPVLPLVNEEQPEPAAPCPGPPQSGVLADVAGASGWPVTLHRAEYTAPSLAGEPTDHGYTWVCRNTACRRVTLGYPSDGYARALGDAEAHDCTAVCDG